MADNQCPQGYDGADSAGQTGEADHHAPGRVREGKPHMEAEIQRVTREFAVKPLRCCLVCGQVLREMEAHYKAEHYVPPKPWKQEKASKL